MTEQREDAAAAHFSNYEWWITGGSLFGSNLDTTDLYTASQAQFTSYINLPKEMEHHNLGRKYYW